MKIYLVQPSAPRCANGGLLKYRLGSIGEVGILKAVVWGKHLDIIITADGSMFLNGTPFPADAENLRAIIIEKTGSRRDIPVSIVADGDTRHAMVVMSMDTVSQLGFKRLSISTQRPAAGE